jgi:16S rRNA (cytidine1402-2'-O)-methyltransferase
MFVKRTDFALHVYRSQTRTGFPVSTSSQRAQGMSAAKSASKKEKSSPDYPRLAGKFAEASRDDDTSKLPQSLYVVATPIGNLGDISLRALWTLMHVDYIACEDTRLSGGLLSRYGIKKPLISYHDHNADKMRPQILQKLSAGESIALISDAGMPLIADPGFKLVRDCREAGHTVTVIPGANAALTALAGSGLATDHFYFAGFLPPKQSARKKAIEELAAIQSTLIFYEAPQRLGDCLADLAKLLGATRPAAVARELTKMFEETITSTLGELAEHYKEQKPKGEIVIIVGPPERKALTVDTSEIDVKLKETLHLLSLRDAVAAVSDATGARKSEVYARALWLKGKMNK